MEEDLADYLHRKCSENISGWDAAQRREVQALAFSIEDWGGEDENDRYVSMDSIAFTRIMDNPFFRPFECLLDVPHFEYRKPLSSYELALYDSWLARHNVLPTGKDEGERNVYSPATSKPFYKALTLACQEAARHLHKHDFAAVLGRSLPVLIALDGCSDEGIISLAATVGCNPPEVMNELFAYVDRARENPGHWAGMLSFE